MGWWRHPVVGLLLLRLELLLWLELLLQLQLLLLGIPHALLLQLALEFRLTLVIPALVEASHLLRL